MEKWEKEKLKYVFIQLLIHHFLIFLILNTFAFVM